MSRSSPDDDYNNGENPSSTVPEIKKRRVQRACDGCRRKKGDGFQMPGNQCSNCIAYSFGCTYAEAAKKRVPPKGSTMSLTVLSFSFLARYVESLENRLGKMEKLLQTVCPDTDLTQEPGGSWIDTEMRHRSNAESLHVMNTPSTSTNTGPSTDEDVVPTDDDYIVTVYLSESLRNMTLNPLQPRFFGKSSGITLLQQAIDVRKEYAVDDDTRTEDFFRTDPRGERFPSEYVTRHIRETEYKFPERDLGVSLIDLYFVYTNHLLPLLHRPTFESRVMRGDHLRDTSFGAVYLLVCAVGSRFSNDPRVFLEGKDSEHSVGWKFFQQVQIVRQTLLEPPCLEDLQVYCASLSVLFLQGTSVPQACWTIVGIGIRLAQDVGAHRRKAYDSERSVEGELWKRAFWVLVVLDRQMSSFLGRPCSIQDEDFDLDLPVECDDEYWEHPDPEQAFKQPSDKPSTMSFFMSFLKLNRVLAFALKTIYSINKSEILLGFVGQRWEQYVVAELDSALNKWVDAVPPHLRWNATRDVNTPLFTQSSVLYASYYLVQILIHRPFIPSPRKPSPLPFPSLAICTNAARSCAHVLGTCNRASPFAAAPFMQMPAYTVGIVLLLNIWGGKQSGLSIDLSKEMADVDVCLSVLKRCEKRWHTSGRFWDVLHKLASVGELPLSQPSPTTETKRERYSNSPSSPSVSTSEEGSRTIAGSRHIPRDAQSQSQSQQHQHVSSTLNLPLYSNDLGRLPLHRQANFPINTSATLSTALAPPQMDSPNVRYPPSSTGTYHPPNGPPPASGPPHTHDFTQPKYPAHEFFYDQSANSFGTTLAARHISLSTQFPGTTSAACAAAGEAVGQAWTGGHAITNESQALMNAQMGTHGHGHWHDVMVPDTIAMWSTAPTGFECVSISG
ncbi:hypothetical protein BS17DRAFT_704855 [Gyrodon lividus]|nr:hypothetical protein BS17DRAFT_704855 [Gyrodon lividus]